MRNYFRLTVLLSPLLFAPSPLLPANEAVSLEVSWNNPFNPSQGETTRFDYIVRGQESPVRLMIFSADGRLVATLAEHVAQADKLYSQAWDGRNAEGRLVDSGVYFASLDAGRWQRKVKRVAVLRE